MVSKKPSLLLFRYSKTFQVYRKGFKNAFDELSSVTLDLISDDQQLYAVCFSGELDLFIKRVSKLYQLEVQNLQSNELPSILSLAESQIQEYFYNQRQHFEIPIYLIGTEFQKKIWNQLRSIPYGQTCSYKELGHQLNIKSGFQSIGQANRSNPLCLVVPCHRVISVSGQMTGYVGGINVKSYLLRLENSIAI